MQLVTSANTPPQGRSNTIFEKYITVTEEKIYWTNHELQKLICRAGARARPRSYQFFETKPQRACPYMDTIHNGLAGPKLKPAPVKRSQSQGWCQSWTVKSRAGQRAGPASSSELLAALWKGTGASATRASSKPHTGKGGPGNQRQTNE